MSETETTMGNKISGFAVFHGLKNGNKFISSIHEGESDEESCKMDDGTIVYEILFKANSIPECQDFLFGKDNSIVNFTNEERDMIAIILGSFSFSLEGDLAKIRYALKKGQNTLNLSEFQKRILSVAIRAYLECITPEEKRDIPDRRSMELNAIAFRLFL